MEWNEELIKRFRKKLNLSQEKYKLALDAYHKYGEIASGQVIYTKSSNKLIIDFVPKDKWKRKVERAQRADVEYGILKAMYELGNKYYEKGNLAEAVKYLSLVSNELVNPPESKKEKEGIAQFSAEIDKVQLLLKTAHILEKVGNLNQATQFYKEILNIDSDNLKAKQALDRIKAQEHKEK